MSGSKLVSRVVSLGILGLGVSLLGLATGTLLFPAWSSQTYGIEVVDVSPEIGWVVATGLRDGVLGLLALSKLFNRQGLLLFLAVVMLLPIGDVLIVANFSHAGWSSVTPHALGVVAIVALIVLVLIERAGQGNAVSGAEAK